MSFYIQYNDGMYNVGSGFPTHNQSEATRYETREEAELAAEDLVDVGGIREDGHLDTIPAVLAAHDNGQISAEAALARIKELTCT